MKKINYGLLIVLLVSLTACSPNNNESSDEISIPIESVESVSSSIDEVSSEVNDLEYSPLADWQEISYEISVGDDLLDVAVKRPFMTNGEYYISYSMNSKIPSDPAGERAVVSNEKVFTVERQGNGFKIKCLHAGQAYLRIYDSLGIIRYCSLITVLDPIPLKNMEEYLVYDCEYWVSVMSWVDGFTLIFNEGGQYTISGYLENSPFSTITGTYEYVQTINNGKEYEYVFTDQDIREIGLKGFHVASTGKFMYLQDNWGTAAIMFPIEEMNKGE